MCKYKSYIFFFQAEDGIRDLVRSRGLGDVYKRQHRSFEIVGRALLAPGDGEAVDLGAVLHIGHRLGPVSYTHLTLPTSDLV